MRDRDIRVALRTDLQREFGSDPDTVVVEELGLCEGEALIDVAVINGVLHGYEIKSARDTLDRLPGQREIYNATLDAVTIVASGAHIAKIKAMVPVWWGIVEAVDAGRPVPSLVPLRDACANPGTDPLAVVRLLWRDEVLAILQERGLARGVVSKPRAMLWRRLVETVGSEELGELVRSRLKTRLRPRAGPRPLRDDEKFRPCAM